MSPVRGARWPLLVLAAVTASLAWRRLDVVTVRGTSMAPTLLPGERLLVVRGVRPPRVGEVVLATDPREPGRELVKRVVDVRGGQVTLRGDSPAASTDSRAFGTLPEDATRWRVLLRYWPPLRIGRVTAAHHVAADAFEAVDQGGEPACAFPEALIAGD